MSNRMWLLPKRAVVKKLLNGKGNSISDLNPHSYSKFMLLFMKRVREEIGGIMDDVDPRQCNLIDFIEIAYKRIDSLDLFFKVYNEFLLDTQHWLLTGKNKIRFDKLRDIYRAEAITYYQSDGRLRHARY